MVRRQTFRRMVLAVIPLAIAGIALYISARDQDTPGAGKEPERPRRPRQFIEAGYREASGGVGVRSGAVRNHPAYKRSKEQETETQYITGLEAFLRMPYEPAASPAAVNAWKFMGPFSASLRGTATDYCGRVRDLEVENVPSMRAAGATGGLFKTFLLFPVPMSDSLNTLSMGAFATSPRDPKLVLLGTGEQPFYFGTGLWRTTDEGGTWTNIPDIPAPSVFYRIMFQPGSGSVAYAACNSGLYKSTDGGENWVLKIAGAAVTGLDVVSTAPNIVYAAKRGDGIYKSTDFGETFAKLSTFPLTGATFNTASLSIARSDIKFVYVSASNNAGTSAGIFRTTDGGTSWQDRTWRDSTGQLIDLHWGQGDRNNCIGVSPTDAQVLLVGGGGLIRSTDGGANYTIPPITHADMCVIRWKSDGAKVYVANDGGIAYSTDAGAVWSTTGSVFPFTQFWSIEAAATGSGMVFVGGTQDNAVVNTSNNGTSWYVNLTGDGAHTTLDKNAPGTQIAMIHSGTGVPHFLNRTTDYGVTWAGIGRDPSRPGGMVRNDQVAPVQYFYVHGDQVYRSTDVGASWTPLGDPLPRATLNAVSVGRRTGALAPVYVVLPDTIVRIMYFDGTNWVPRNSGLPSAYFNNISQHPTNNNFAYAYTYYDLYPGNKIFRTTNRGQTWTNISGDFPNLNVTGVVAHPTNSNILFASTTWYGVFKTTNGGANWFRWMNGMPKTLWVEALAYVDSSAINGKFYVVAGSHGRGAWVREAGGDETATSAASGEQPLRFALGQNFPNPFNPSTSIMFELPAKDRVTLEVFDINGKVVREVIRGQEYPAGTHRVRFDASGLASGTYFYRLTSARFSSVKKMMLVK